MIFLTLLGKELFKVKTEVWETSVLVPAQLQASFTTLAKHFNTLHPFPSVCTLREVRLGEQLQDFR